MIEPHQIRTDLVMAFQLALAVGLWIGAMGAGVVYVGVSEITGSQLAGGVAGVLAAVAEYLTARAVARLMVSDAAAAAAEGT